MVGASIVSLNNKIRGNLDHCLKAVLIPANLERAHDAPWLLDGRAGELPWHPWTMSSGMCQGGSLESHATVRDACILHFPFALIVEIKFPVLPRS